MLFSEKEINEIRNNMQWGSWNYQRFNYCNAYIVSWDNCAYIIPSQYHKNIGIVKIQAVPIKSYNTVVGVVIKAWFENDITLIELYEIGKYSRTTSKQVTQIHNQVYPYADNRYHVNRV